MSAKKKQHASKKKQQTAKSHAAAQSTKNQSAKKDKKSPMVIAVIVILALVMALSISLPSLTAIFAHNPAPQDASTTQDEQATTAAATAAATNSASVAGVDAQYQALVDSLKSKLDKDPDNLAHTLNIANDYMAWAQSAQQYATTDDEKNHVSELWQSAIDYYNKYLKLNDSQDVHVRIALCTYYKGDSEGALKMLEDFTAGAGKDYGPAWAYLGFMQESAGKTDDAKKSYTTATAADKDDTYGAKSYATERLAQLNASESAATAASTQKNLQSDLTSMLN